MILLLALSAQAAIFGQDDRNPVSDHAPYSEAARSVAIAVLSANFTPAATGKFDLTTDPLSELVCKDQRFSDNPSLSYSCTGFLVAPDLLVTAGHCSVNTGESHNETDTYCATFSWLFDYRAGADGQTQLAGIDDSKLYHCKQTIFAVVDEQAPYRDYALIQLDRKVTDRTPIVLSEEAVKVTDAVSMLGFPLGTPMKYTDNAKVTITDPTRLSFVTNLDAFEGNSGSPVLNAKLEAVGILIAGTPSPSLIEIPGPAGSCYNYNRCDDDGKNCQQPDDPKASGPGYQGQGSEVERIQPVIDLIRSLKL